MIFALLSWAIDIYSLIVLAAVVISWVAPQSRHPFVQLIHRATEPVLEAIRKVLPAMNGIDFSPMILLVGLRILQRLL